MTALSDMVEKVRGTLSVSSSYDTLIQQQVEGAMMRLLQDYNFPKTIRKQEYSSLAVGEDTFALPSFFKKPLAVRIHIAESGTHFYSDPLGRSQGFVLPSANGTPAYYWLENESLVLNCGMPSAGYDIFLWYQTKSLMLCQDWLLSDLNDAVFYFSLVRCCPLVKKAELLETFASLWSEERTSLAIFANELEFNDSEIQMREPYGQRSRSLTELSNFGGMGIASTIEAIGGESNLKLMTPLRTKEAIDEQVFSARLNYSVFVTDFVSSGVDITGVTDSLAGFQACFNATDDGQEIVIPPGTYKLSGQVTNSEEKTVIWQILGVLSDAQNWADLLPGVTRVLGHRDNLGSEAVTGGLREELRSPSVVSKPSYDFFSTNMVWQAAADRVNGRRFSTAVNAGASGIVQNLTAELYFLGTPGNTSGNGNYVALQSNATAGFPAGGGPDADSLFGGNDIAILTSGATGWYNVSGREINVDTAEACDLRFGLNVTGRGLARGATLDSAIFVNYDFAGQSWKTALQVGGLGSFIALGTDGQLAVVDIPTGITSGISFGTTPVSGNMLEGVGVGIGSAVTHFSSQNYALRLGNAAVSNTPVLQFYSSGINGVDAAISCSGGTGSNDGSLLIGGSEQVFQGNLRPETANSNNIGTASHPFAGGFVQTALTVTSSREVKEKIEDIPVEVAMDIVKQLTAKFFVFKDEAIDALTTVIEEQKQKSILVKKQRLVDRYEVQPDGSALLIKEEEEYEVEEKLWNEHIVIDAAGNPIVDTIFVPAKDEATGDVLRDAAGRIIKKAITQQRVHRTPVMEAVTEIKEVVPAYFKANVRRHAGFLVEDLLDIIAARKETTSSWASVIIDNATGKKGLRLEEIFALLFPVVQNLIDRVERLEKANA